MAIDRTVALRDAEKLVRQGKLDLAIAQYLRIVEDQPLDWNTANQLGDLYVRAGQMEEAIARFARVADGFRREGFLAKAAALYKKILRLSPHDEHALLGAAEMASEQGLLVDARRLLLALADRRRKRGDESGVADAAARLAALDAEDRDGPEPNDGAPTDPVFNVGVERGITTAEATPHSSDRALDDGERRHADDERAAVEAAAPVWVDDLEASPASIPPSVVPEDKSQSTAPVRESSPVAPPQHPTEAIEVDLSVVLEGIQRPSGSVGAPVDIDDVFARLRREADRLSTDTGEQEFKKGMTLFEAGRLDESLTPLLAASRAPRFRLQAALAVGRIFRARGQVLQAVEWFERGAEAPAETPDLGHQLLYELADALETTGEVGRALAVCLELQADAGEFRDVAQRIDRLARVQARG